MKLLLFYYFYSQQVLRISPLATEWGSSKGGLSTLNREMCKGLAQQPDVLVTLVVPEYTEEERKEASKDNVRLAAVEKMSGISPILSLSYPPDDCNIDIVMGHGQKLGPPAQVVAKQRKCKRVHVVHTASEELAMFKKKRPAISEGESKHKIEVDLSKTADVVVGIGPKLTEAIKSSLRPHKKDKDVINFTPGIFTEFSGLEQASEERKTFLTLVFGRGDEEDFELKGYDVAARAIAGLNDSCYHLVFVGAPDGKQEEVKDNLLECGISKTQLKVRSYRESRQMLAELFSEADLAIMPSRTEGFGLAALEALSAGLPILVSNNSGFGKALEEIPFGMSFVVESDDPEEWGRAIKRARKKSRDVRLKEAADLRAYYDERYKWQEQCAALVDKLR